MKKLISKPLLSQTNLVPLHNVTLEATNKRLLLAAHYGQVRRNMELVKYNELLVELAKTNTSLANTLLNAAEVGRGGGRCGSCQCS